MLGDDGDQALTEEHSNQGDEAQSERCPCKYRPRKFCLGSHHDGRQLGLVTQFGKKNRSESGKKNLPIHCFSLRFRSRVFRFLTERSTCCYALGGSSAGSGSFSSLTFAIPFL